MRHRKETEPASGVYLPVLLMLLVMGYVAAIVFWWTPILQ